jgi:NADH dehydrogenase
MILIVGATGYLGGMITRGLLAQGRLVRVLVRPGSDYRPLVEAGSAPALGDLRQRDTLDVACRNVDTVITTAIARMHEEGAAQAINLDGYLNLIDAAKAAGVKHFIFTSVLGGDPDSPAPFVAAKGKVEQHLRASGIPYTILAPDIFMDIWIMAVIGGPALQGAPVWLVGEGRDRHSFVAGADVAAFALNALDNPAAVNQTIPIGGPAALSWLDVVGVFEQILGRSIQVNHVLPGEPLPGLPPFMAELMAGFSRYDSIVPMGEIAPRFGVQLTSLEEFVQRAQVNT